MLPVERMLWTCPVGAYAVEASAVGAYAIVLKAVLSKSAPALAFEPE